jgi:hypothetical protein
MKSSPSTKTAHAHEPSQPKCGFRDPRSSRNMVHCSANGLRADRSTGRLVRRKQTSTNVHTIGSGYAPVAFRFQIELRVPVPNGKITVSLADVQSLVLYTHAVELRQQSAGKIRLGLELPLLPLKPGEYILSCTISDGIHPVAFLRAIPELTVQEEENAARSGYHGILNLPAKLSVEG